MRALLQWLWLGALVGLASGAASALFLLLLAHATHYRETHNVIVYALPLAGLAIGVMYERWGGTIRGGNNLILDVIHDEGHDEGERVPLRMAPMVLFGTVATHLFGGSAGREGTAVQMGASLADEIGRRFRVSKDTRRQLLAAGIAGGFGSVFGTPIAGLIFGLEVVCIGRLEHRAFVPALVASFIGDYVTRHLVAHTVYPAVARVPLTPLVLGKLIVLGAAMALATIAFVALTHGMKKALEARVPRLPIRMFLGGVVVVLLWKVVGTDDYLGLGVPVIVRAFTDPNLVGYAFALKLLFTAITLSSGFIGGEVTPLFFVGATLGSVCARLLGLPIELGAGVGLAAVFAAAANTPIALTIMAVELLGAGIFPHAAIVCVVAFLLSGHRGIYPSQRIARSKLGRRFSSPVPLRDYPGP